MDRLQMLSLLLDPIAWGMPFVMVHGDLENNKNKNIQKKTCSSKSVALQIQCTYILSCVLIASSSRLLIQ